MYTYVQYVFKNFHPPLYHFSNKCLSRFKNSRGKKGFKAASASRDTGTAALSTQRSFCPHQNPSASLISLRLIIPKEDETGPTLKYITYVRGWYCLYLSTYLHMFTIYLFWKGHGEKHFSALGAILTKEQIKDKIYKGTLTYNQEKRKKPKSKAC